MAAKAFTLVWLLLLSFSASVPFVAGGELSFLALGDWGGNELKPYTTPFEMAVSKGMSKIAENLETQFIVALGDNFYHFGVKNVDDKRFKETFEDVFTAKSLMTPWYFCAGNHDYSGNVSAQIAYSSRSKRWNFPYYYYTKSWKIPGSDIELQLVLLDTVQLCGDSGDDHFNTQPQEPESQKASEIQWKWIEDTLQSSTAHYLIVGGHFPVWSVAEHGPTDCLVNRLRPLLQKYKVTAYISGHDHNLQHLKESNSSVEYFVIGSAAYIVDKKTHKNSVPKGSLSFFWADADKEGGFAAVRVAATNMTLEFVDAFGASLYKRQLYPRNIHLTFK